MFPLHLRPVFLQKVIYVYAIPHYASTYIPFVCVALQNAFISPENIGQLQGNKKEHLRQMLRVNIFIRYKHLTMLCSLPSKDYTTIYMAGLLT